MEESREERMQQRLRGAARRQIKEVDFGLSVPAPPPAVVSPGIQSAAQSASTTVQPLPPDNPTTTPARTPSVRARDPSQSTNDANTSAKRRKLNSDPPAPPSSARSTRSQRSQPRPDIYDIPNDEVPASAEVASQDVNLSASADFVDPERIPETQESVEANITAERVSSGAAAAISIPGQDLVQNTKIPSSSRVDKDVVVEEASSADIETPIPARKRKRTTAPGRRSTRLSLASTEDDIDELSPQQYSKSAAKSKPTVSRRGRVDDDQDPLSDPIEDEEMAEEVDDIEAARVLTKPRSKRKSINTLPEPETEDIEEPIQPKRKKRRREVEEASRAEQRQPKKSSSQTQPSKKQGKSKRKPKFRAGSPIPVIVHRLTEAPIYEGDDPDVDILNAEIPNIKRSGVNSIDVLRQICQEIFGGALETLQGGRNNVDDPALRREYMTKHRAVSSFAEVVYARLVEHTINLDNNYHLSQRLKSETKKKLHLREEILHVRAEREKVALRMDEVRAQHEKASKTANERSALNTSLHDIELAVDRGRQGGASDEEGGGEKSEALDLQSVEVKIKRVADLASGKSNGGGLLARIKSFNDFLERAALVLEAKRA